VKNALRPMGTLNTDEDTYKLFAPGVFGVGQFNGVI